MHGADEFVPTKSPSLGAAPSDPNLPWWHEMTGYHWFVLIVAALGWLFDCMDQQLFNLVRVSAMRALLPVGEDGLPDPAQVRAYSGYATSIFLLGWATGGLVFGVLGDRIGRARTMMWTILLYSAFTGLSAISVGFWDFAFYRFLTGLGVGGEFAVGVALVAEVMPETARARALALLQTLSAVGNITAAFMSMGLGHLEETGAIGSAWRWAFVIGTAPALLALVIRARLREPQRWQDAVSAASPTSAPLDGSADAQPAAATNPLAAKPRAGSYSELLGDPTWRRHALLGLMLAFSGVVGLWGITFFSIDLIQSVLRKHFETTGEFSASQVNGKVTFWAGIASLMLQVGALAGMYTFGVLAQRYGRRPVFVVFLLAAAGSTAFVFLFLKSFTDVFWMQPIMGFCQFALFSGYAIYLPELFPTRLRSTAVSFCYNVGRYLAATGPALLGLLSTNVYHEAAEPLRLAGVTMCAVYLVGLVAIPFLPETKGKPLPD